MIYEVRMTLGFAYKDGSFRDPRRFKTTLIEYIGAKDVAEAFNKAAERKHEIIIGIAKGEATLWDEKAWGPRSESIEISIDAVVAKPEISPKQLCGKVRMLDYFIDKDRGRIECRLNTGQSIIFTEEGIDALRDAIRQ